MEWFVLLIPILFSLIAYLFYRKYFAIWEYLLFSLSTVVLVLIFKVSVKTALVSDDEYWGALITEARYYEPYETWVTATCSYCCGTDKDGNCTSTCYYDCSYCDYTSEKYYAYSNAGDEYRISKEYYQFLLKKWNSAPFFVELNRDIDYNGGCGKDGDMYKINWNGKVESSESSVTIHSYTNKVQASHSAFKLPYINKKEAKQKGLYDYPNFYDYYKQKVILGLDSIYNDGQIEQVETKFQFLNGYLGKRSKVKLFVVLFFDKPLSISHAQEAYWSGGNQNEVVVCIGLNRTSKEINWVRSFSWTNSKKICVDLREDISEIKYFNPDKVWSVCLNVLNNKKVYRNFKKDFDYLTIDLPTWSLILMWILAVAANGLIFRWCIINEYQ